MSLIETSPWGWKLKSFFFSINRRSNDIKCRKTWRSRIVFKILSRISILEREYLSYNIISNVLTILRPREVKYRKQDCFLNPTSNSMIEA